MNNLLTESDTAKLLKVSIKLLRKWRTNKNGPAFLRFGRLIRYAPDDLEKFLNTKRQPPLET
jgi:hypothetical protein